MVEVHHSMEFDAPDRRHDRAFSAAESGVWASGVPGAE
jgi:hypothetical protein